MTTVNSWNQVSTGIHDIKMPMAMDAIATLKVIRQGMLNLTYFRPQIVTINAIIPNVINRAIAAPSIPNFKTKK